MSACSFHLTTVYLSLIEPPAPGKALNPLFRNRLFWIAFALIACIHLFNGLCHLFSPLLPAHPALIRHQQHPHRRTLALLRMGVQVPAHLTSSSSA